jgi:hypothetical protein
LLAVIDSCLLTSESLEDACDATGVFQILEPGLDEAAGRQRTSDVAQLGCSMQLSAEISASGAVAHVDLDLRDSQAGSQGVDGHAYFHSPTGSQWAGKFERSPGKAALT